MLRILRCIEVWTKNGSVKESVLLSEPYRIESMGDQTDAEAYE